MKLLLKLAALTAAVLLTACASHSTQTETAAKAREGVFIVGFTADENLRVAIEDQLVGDLRARDVVAFVSHADIPVITDSSRAQVIQAANARKATSILVINQVAADGSDSVVRNAQRVSPNHPDLRAFYEYTEQQLNEPMNEGQRVFAEVNLFVLEGDRARLYWSGTTWSFHADGQGTALRNISQLIADQLRSVARTIRPTASD